MDYLPRADGLLPYFVFLIGVTAMTNAISTYNTDSYIRRVYSTDTNSHDPRSELGGITKTTSFGVESIDPPADRRPSATSIAVADVPVSPVTPLTSRVFGTWNFAVGLVRVFAAYHLNEPAWYQLQMLTTIIALVHFSMEVVVYQTARPTGPVLVPMAVAITGTVWSLAQYSYYVK